VFYSRAVVTVTATPNMPCAGCGKRTRGRDGGGEPRCNACKGVVRLDWARVLDHARKIVESYDTGVTLRQLFYRLVADGTLPNLITQYHHLSEHTARARRESGFPGLLDRTSRIEQWPVFSSPAEAVENMQDTYRRDRTEGQPWTIYLGVEKAGMSEQLNAWFTDPLGIPHVALGGYASQTLCDQVRRDVEDQGRPAVLIYAGDHDPTGEDIDRDFTGRTGCWDEVVRVALSRGQVEQYGLPENSSPEVAAKLESDPRAGAFLARHGDLVQFEVDALGPASLRKMYRRAIGRYWDDGVHAGVLEREEAERDLLSRLRLPGEGEQ
jgi:hypothetical protein